jgi:hypothetical protein
VAFNSRKMFMRVCLQDRDSDQERAAHQWHMHTIS